MTQGFVNPLISGGGGGGGSGWVKIASQVASNSPSITFSGLTSAYSAYIVIMEAVIPVTLNVTPILTYNSITAGYSYVAFGYLAVGAAITNYGTAAAAIQLSGATLNSSLSNAANAGYNGILYLYNPDSANQTYCNYWCAYNAGSGNALAEAHGAGNNTSLTPITSITFAMSSGNIASGVYTLYGVPA